MIKNKKCYNLSKEKMKEKIHMKKNIKINVFKIVIIETLNKHAYAK